MTEPHTSTYYAVAERFKSLQGEGAYAGCPMAFIRFVGCSVGKKVCAYCDTDFEHSLPWRGGGSYTEEDLLSWAYPYTHICLTGGEPLDQNLVPLIQGMNPADPILFHLETSGTKVLDAFSEIRAALWVCVSPKPGFIESVVAEADEVKVIVPGLGVGSGWPSLDDALRWAAAGQLVYLQPKAGKHEIDKQNLRYVLDLLQEHPQLRLSCQLHKILQVQ